MQTTSLTDNLLCRLDLSWRTQNSSLTCIMRVQIEPYAWQSPLSSIGLHADGTHDNDDIPHCIEVGDLGLVPIETIHRTLARHERCTCHHNEPFFHDPPLLPTALDIDSDADSDTLSICSSSEMIRSFSSSTSLSSMAATDRELPFPPIFRPLELTAADLDVQFNFHEADDFVQFDLW